MKAAGQGNPEAALTCLSASSMPIRLDVDFAGIVQLQETTRRRMMHPNKAYAPYQLHINPDWMLSLHSVRGHTTQPCHSESPAPALPPVTVAYVPYSEKPA
jgi:hypothetical protein